MKTRPSLIKNWQFFVFLALTLLPLLPAESYCLAASVSIQKCFMRENVLKINYLCNKKKHL
jgi:hypothetical protein